MFRSTRRRAGCARSVTIVYACLSAILLLGSPVLASENYGYHYSEGNDDFMVGGAAPPGFYFIDYVNYYTAGKLLDNDRNRIPRDFRLDSYSNTFLFLYSSQLTLLGGNLRVVTIVPIVRLHLSTSDGSQSSAGPGDFVLGPSIAWHTRNFDWSVGGNVIAPVGHYAVNDLANVGRNYWSIYPVFMATYVSDGGWEASGKLMYFFNTTNNSNNYRSGQELALDYLLGKHFWNAAVGINGHCLLQTTDDTQDGAMVADKKSSFFSVGPAIQYAYGKIAFTLKYQIDVTAKNRPQGQSVWLNFNFAF